jgi:hypothetical protein
MYNPEEQAKRLLKSQLEVDDLIKLKDNLDAINRLLSK